jgi:hypothetical protein
MVFFFALFFLGGGQCNPQPGISNGPSLKVTHYIYLWPEVHCICQSCWFQLYLYLQCSKIVSHNRLVIHAVFNVISTYFFAGHAKTNILSLNTKMKCHGNEIWLAYYFLIIFFRLYYIPQIPRGFFFQNVCKIYRRLNDWRRIIEEFKMIS